VEGILARCDGYHRMCDWAQRVNRLTITSTRAVTDHVRVTET
jgi:hypothetical protein